MIVPSPVPDAGANFNAELGHDALHEALEVTVMRLVPAGSKRRSAGASESVTSAEAAARVTVMVLPEALPAAVRTPTSTDVPRGMSSTRKVPLPTPAEGSTVTAAEAGSQ